VKFFPKLLVSRQALTRRRLATTDATTVVRDVTAETVSPSRREMALVKADPSRREHPETKKEELTNVTAER
jgi:hypothetical protein